MSLSQIIGNVCVAIAAFMVLLPLQSLLSKFAPMHLSDDRWVTPALFILVPLWLVLMVALLCVTASGGFDWLRLGRPALYALTVGATVAVGAAAFAFIGLYLRPGFMPRIFFSAPLYLVHFVTMLLVILSLNPKLALVMSPQAVRLPWTIFAALSLVACMGLLGYQLFNSGVGSMVGSVVGATREISHPGPSDSEILAKIPTADPKIHFSDLLGLTGRRASRTVREAATARLRSHPQFIDALANQLSTGGTNESEQALEFLYSATLSTQDAAQLVGPARGALERFVSAAPAPNYTTKQRMKEVRNWGTEMFDVLPKKFAGTGVDFAELKADFEDKVNPQ